MKLVGLDIGTTTICGMLLDAEDGRIVSVTTEPNPSALPGQQPGDSLQDADVALGTVREIVDGFLHGHRDISGIGVAGQMHGILYVDDSGNAASPLYTWQDGRGDLPFQDGTYASSLSLALGRPVSTGMGSVTHFFNVKNAQVPSSASCLCTIADYAAMKLAGARRPVMDATNAASLGAFDPVRLGFDRAAISRAGMDAGIFPEVRTDYAAIGEARPGVPVFPGIGDNQGSFIGSVQDSATTVLVNVGTSGQISLFMESWREIAGIDLRPLPFGGYIGVGAALCGGRAYAVLREFFRRTVRAFTGRDDPLPWEALNALAEEAEGETDALVVDTRFSGTRMTPSVRGGITNVGLSNFTPAQLARGVREGIVSELLDFYGLFSDAERARTGRLVGSGNAVRMNPALRRSFESRFGMKLSVPRHREETSFGAALVAGVASGVIPNLAAAGSLIRYEEAGS